MAGMAAEGGARTRAGKHDPLFRPAAGPAQLKPWAAAKRSSPKKRPPYRRPFFLDSSPANKNARLIPGAGDGVADGTRPHDDQNHNLGLYKLSYSHRRAANYRRAPPMLRPGLRCTEGCTAN